MWAGMSSTDKILLYSSDAIAAAMEVSMMSGAHV